MKSLLRQQDVARVHQPGGGIELRAGGPEAQLGQRPLGAAVIRVVSGDEPFNP